MHCPADIEKVVLELLAHGILRIRAFAGAKEPNRCFVEADHLHNLPQLLADYRPERLRYYWEVERPSFMEQVPEPERRDLADFWNRLAELVHDHRITPEESHIESVA